MDESAEKLRSSILLLLDQRDAGKTICPSEAARLAFPDHWREYMIQTREVAIILQDEGLLDFYRKGNRVDSRKVRGPYRLRKR